MWAIFLAASLAVTPRALLFDAGPKGWLVLSSEGRVLKRVSTIAGHRPEDAAISPDATRWAFIARGHLFVWADGWAEPIELPRKGSVLATPAFDASGQWVYFIQNEFESKQRPHAPMEYAQIWRVKFGERAPVKLTASPGCHMWPVPMPNGGTLFSHATCVSGRGIAILSPSGRERQIVAPTSEIGEGAIAPSGSRAVFLRDLGGTNRRLQVIEVDLASGRELSWAMLSWYAARGRPGWGADGQSVWIQNHEAVWRVSSAGEVTRHLEFSSLTEAQ